MSGLRDDPIIAGLYFLWRKPAELVYVGISQNVHARLRAHLLNGRRYDYATIMAVPYEYILDIERALIAHLGPRENNGGGLPKPPKPVQAERLVRRVHPVSPEEPAPSPGPQHKLLSKAAAVALARPYHLTSKLIREWHELPFTRPAGLRRNKDGRLAERRVALEADVRAWCEEHHNHRLKALGFKLGYATKERTPP